VLSFFSSRWNWNSHNPSPAGECAPPPVLGGGAHSLARKGLGESQFRRGDIHCGTPVRTLWLKGSFAMADYICQRVVPLQRSWLGHPPLNVKKLILNFNFKNYFYKRLSATALEILSVLADIAKNFQAPSTTALKNLPQKFNLFGFIIIFLSAVGDSGKKF
jgi:hypothetical protein